MENENKKLDYNSLGIICANCMDFNYDDNTCSIRYVIHKDRSKTLMPRKPNQRGCNVFMQK